MNDSLSCPGCKTTKYAKPDMKLMVNICGHSLCENCVNTYFVRGYGDCLQCETNLRRNNFRIQTFDDAGVEKDIDIRRKVLREFNKKEEDFFNLREYNDYLEEVETIIYNLTNNIDVERTRQKIENYKRDNLDLIKKNKMKRSRDEEYIDELLEEEREQRQFHEIQELEENKLQMQEKQKQKNEYIDNLMFSDLPVEHIMKTHTREIMKQEKRQPLPVPQILPAQRLVKFSTGSLPVRTSLPKPVVPSTMGSNVRYTYIPLQLDYAGPHPPHLEELGKLRYLLHIKPADEIEKAGGFQSSIACHRALQDSFCGLYY